MERERDSLTQQGAAMVAAQLRGDHDGRDRLIKTFVWERGFPRLIEAFSYTAIVAVDVAADLHGTSFCSTLDLVDARHGRRPASGTTVPWTKALRLAAATKTDEHAAATIRSTMDVHSAVTATFQLAFTAFLTLADASGPCGRSAEEWATAAASGEVATLAATA